jgi:hypothetical protein
VGRRLTRKQIKQDEFITLFDKIVHWLTANWQQTTIILGSAIGLMLLVWGISALLGSRSNAAGLVLSQAIDTYNAPVGPDAPKEAKIKFGTDTERLSEAEKLFSKVKSSYWLTAEARLATVFLATIAADRGDRDGAIRTLTSLASKHTADPVVRLATLALIRLRLAKGEASQLVVELEEMAAGKDPRLPRDAAIFELARVREQEGKPAEAAKLYRKLVDDFPDSAYRMDAQQRLNIVI